MQDKITVIINTYNEAKTLERVISSVKWADEIIVCDMQSDDDSAVIAKKLGAKVIFHKKLPFVEPARNFAISKASNDWVLVLDPDEEIPESLAKRLQEMLEKPIVSTYVEIPRKNIIFNKWIKSSLWWPDYNIRFFRKDSVTWGNKIHSKPKTVGQGITLPSDERWAITHYHYSSISEFIIRLDRYTSVEAKELRDSGIEFSWPDLILKPSNEFLSRFFANRGFEDGLHGLSLSLLQAFSFFIAYLKLWEYREFKEEKIDLKELQELTLKGGEDLSYWFKYGNLSKNPLKRVLQKAKNKIV